MKVILVGLISLIIFNIVLANNGSDSRPTTNSVIYENLTKIHHIVLYSSLLEEKTKKAHKTTEESVNVKGKRPYKKGYEESYGDMVKDIFMPLEDDYQYSRNNSHKQDDAPHPASKGPEKQKFTEKRQLNTINENNEIFQKLKDLSCIDPEEYTKTNEKTKTESKKRYPTSNEVYNKHKQLLCADSNEITNAVKLMDEAAKYLEKHITNKEGYQVYKWCPYYNRTFTMKKHGDIIVQGINYKYYHPNNYNEIINLLWNPAFANDFDNGSVKRKIVRVYNPNTVMIQQRYNSWDMYREKYFYALAAKIDISKDKTIIVMTSAKIKDRNRLGGEYKNKIIENANSFKTKIDSEDEIKKGEIKKTFVNIAGYLIEKKSGYVDITYIQSINEHSYNCQELFYKTDLSKFLES